MHVLDFFLCYCNYHSSNAYDVTFSDCFSLSNEAPCLGQLLIYSLMCLLQPL